MQYGFAKKIFSAKGFQKWYEDVLILKDIPKEQWTEINMNDYKNVSQVKSAVETARKAVSGYSQTNATRKAVEALADALEQAQG